ncbi:MAG: CotH kinase family protein, partial [Bacteroidaceae bacterium]|nr:CotH kinase family protein [Bacteroidaceae bacterium]
SADGNATIGIRKDQFVYEDWTCIDTWKLEMWGELVAVTGVALDVDAAMTIIAGEQLQLKAHILPTNATLPGLLWETSNIEVATVDENGYLTANSAGTCSITVSSKATPGKMATISLTVKDADVKPGSLVINEIQSANIDMFLDPSFNYGSWIELRNTTAQNISLAKLYITDDPADLKKYRLPTTIGLVPANGFKVLWFDHNNIWTLGEHNQIPFSLDYNGGTIILSNGTDILVQADYPQGIMRTSYARTTDCGQQWGITANPTPGSSNAASSFDTEQLDAPVVDKDAQLFTGTLTVKVDIPSGTTLRYTTDGSTPTPDNGTVSTTGKFNVTNTTAYRFRLFRDGMIPSPVVTRTYIYNDRNYTLPIISVNGSPQDLFGADHGVFTKGNGNGRPGNGQSAPCNWNMDWDRPVNFEYIGSQGDGADYRMLFNQEVDLERCGGWSRAWTPYSFKLKAAKCYDGQNSLNYPFFPNKPFIKNKTLQIRNGGNDTGCRIKDAALQEIVSRSGLYVDGQQWQPVMHFINGQYMGVLNMREPNNKHFAYANYGIDTDAMDQFEISPDSGYVQKEGTKEAWNKLYTLSKNASSQTAYEEISRLIDIDEYLNYMAVQFYLGGGDFPQNNVKGFRSAHDGKFHFVLFDLDAAFSRTEDAFNGFMNSVNRSGDTLYGKYWNGESIEGKRLQLQNEFVLLFKNMMQNQQFCKEFTNRFCIIASSVFHPTRCKSIVTEMATKMEGPMSYANWYDGGNSPWYTANDIINRLSTNRIQAMTAAMASFFSIKTAQQEATIRSNTIGAKLTVNDFEIPTGTLDGYLYTPATVRAHPLAGYKFIGWRSGDTSSYESTALFSSGDTWNYYDGGSLDGKTWKTGTLSSGWKTGKTTIGYNSADNLPTKTVKNLPTYYFRITTTLAAAPQQNAVFNLSYTIDDGFIIYVNGTEAARYNMPAGSVSYNTYASTYAQGNPDTGTLTLPTSLFKTGENIIAVEVHNNSNTSTDIMWDATLTMLIPTSSGGQIVSTDAEYKLPTYGKINLTAVYEKQTDDEIAKTGTVPVRINEVSADNSIYVNDYFKKDDWIELYNTTDKPVDVAGMYLSDNPDKPRKYCIAADDPKATIIQPYGHLIVWAGKREYMGGQLHANFKLANEDNQQVILTSQDASWSDVLKYGVQGADETVGRYPDGGNNVYKLQHPTINNTNILTLYAEYLYTTEPDPSDIHHATADINDADIVNTAYYHPNGVYAGDSLNKLPKGIYILKQTMRDGTVKAKKIVR